MFFLISFYRAIIEKLTLLDLLGTSGLLFLILGIVFEEVHCFNANFSGPWFGHRPIGHQYSWQFFVSLHDDNPWRFYIPLHRFLLGKCCKNSRSHKTHSWINYFSTTYIIWGFLSHQLHARSSSTFCQRTTSKCNRYWPSRRSE